MGVTFLFSSGDDGVAGGGGYCLNADGNANVNYCDPRLISCQEAKPLTAQSSTLPSPVHVRILHQSALPRSALASLYGNPKMRVKRSYILGVDSVTISGCLTIRRLPSKST